MNIYLRIYPFDKLEHLKVLCYVRKYKRKYDFQQRLNATKFASIICIILFSPTLMTNLIGAISATFT